MLLTSQTQYRSTEGKTFLLMYRLFCEYLGGRILMWHQQHGRTLHGQQGEQLASTSSISSGLRKWVTLCRMFVIFSRRACWCCTWKPEGFTSAPVKTTWQRTNDLSAVQTFVRDFGPVRGRKLLVLFILCCYYIYCLVVSLVFHTYSIEFIQLFNTYNYMNEGL